MRSKTHQLSWRRIRHLIRWVTLDASIMALAFLVGFSARSLTATLDLPALTPIVILIILITLVSLYVNGVYSRIWSQTSGHDVVTIVRASAIAGVLSLLLNLSYQPRVPLSVLFVGMALSVSSFVMVRYQSRLLWAFGWRWRAIWHREFPIVARKERVLIIGAGSSGQSTALNLRHNSEKNLYHVVGFLDDKIEKQGMYLEGCPVLGTINEAVELSQAYEIDLIVVAIHNISGERFRRILETCETTEARIKVVPDMMKLFNNAQHSEFLRDVQPDDLIGRHTISRHADIDLSVISERVVLVTGAAGSIGSELSQQILAYRPSKLLVLDNNESALHDLQLELHELHPDMKIIAVLIDVRDRKSLHNLFQQYKPQLVFHAAAYKHVPMLQNYPQQAISVNVFGTRNVAEEALLHGADRFVLISTDKAVEPSSIMGASKRICELIVRAMAQRSRGRTRFTAVRFGNVLGSRGSVVPIFNRQIDKGGPVTVTDADMKRYFMSIAEAVNLVIHAAAMTNGNDLYVLKMGEEVRIMDLAERMIRLRGMRPHRDIEIVVSGVRPGEKIEEALYEENENPTPTVHPHIMTLAKQGAIDDHTSFMGQLDALIAQQDVPWGAHVDPALLLQTMLDIIYAERTVLVEVCESV